MLLIVHLTTLLIADAAVKLKPNPPLGPETVYNEAGYIDLESPPRQFFYWFFESRSNPSLDPFILWMSGGPGCSSQLALFMENGPYRVTKESGVFNVSLNPFSWNTNATVLWLDQPAGAGFSEGTLEYSSQQVGTTVYEVMTKFLDSHTNYSNLPFYIFGESYAGHYVPAVASVMMQNIKAGKSKINLKGVAIGNGLTSPAKQYAMYPEFAREHNLVSHFGTVVMTAGLVPCEYLAYECSREDLEWERRWLSCFNGYVACSYAEVLPVQLTGVNVYDVRRQCGGNTLCYDFSTVTEFLNRVDVQKALGVDKVYKECDNLVNMEFVAGADEMHSWEPQIAELLGEKVKVLIYAGEYDFICNWMGNWNWVQNMAWSRNSSFAKAENKTWSPFGRVAGYSVSAGGLTFLKLKDAGHLSPMDQPENTLEMVRQYTLSPHGFEAAAREIL